MDDLIDEFFAANELARKEQIMRSMAERLRTQGILPLVQSLQSQLTGPDENTRTESTSLLAGVLEHISVPIAQQQTLYLFFCSRLPDGSSFLPAIQGLVAIKYVGDVKVLREAIDASKFRSKPQPARHAAFGYLDKITPSPETFDLFIDMVSGEKDPQNLLTTLKISKKFGDAFALTDQQKEELFDVTFCYFPITFKPPKDMHYEVDVDEIKATLRAALCCTSLSEHVVPGLISKLNAINPDVKADVLLTLNQVVRSYPDEVLNAWWQSVWDNLKYEIIHGSVENPNNAAVALVLQRLNTIPAFVDEVCSELAATVDTTKKAIAIQLCVLASSLSTNQELFSRYSSPLLDILLREQKVAVIEILNYLLATKFHLPSHNDQILSLYMSGLASTDYNALALEGLPLLAIHEPEYAPVICNGISKHLPQHRAVNALVQIAKIHSSAVLNECMSTLLAQVGDAFSPEAKQSLQILGQLAVTKDLVQTLTIRLVSRAEQVQDSLYLFEILSAILAAVNHLQAADLARYYKYVSPLLPSFFTSQPKPAFLNDIVLDRMSQIMEITARAIPEQHQTEYAEEICRLVWPDFNCVLGQTPNVLQFLLTSCLVAIDEQNLPARFQVSFVQMCEVLRRARQVFARAGYLRFLAVAVNKWPTKFGDIPLAIKLLRTSVDTNHDAISDLEVLVWVGKGLVMRNDKLGFQVAGYITQLLHDPRWGSFAGRVFGVLVMDDRVMCKENRLVVRQLYRQKLFVQELPPLLDGFKQPGEVKLNSMMALSALIRYCPSPILSEHLDKILPVLVESLQPQVPPSLQLNALGTILATMEQQNAHAIYESVLAQIVDLCLKLATTIHLQHNATVQARAIEVLYSMAVHMPRSSTRVYAPTILRTLPAALSSIKREVRRQATRCIQTYHVL